MLSKFTQEGGCRARNRTQQSWVSLPLLTVVINKTWCCESISNPGLLSGVCCPRQCKKMVTFPPQNASKLKDKCRTDEQPWIRKDVQDSRNRTVYTDWPGNSSLYINDRKGNDDSPVTFSLAVTISLPCRPGSWSPAPPRQNAAQPRCPGGRAGWRRCKRRCCHLLEPPEAGREHSVQGPAGDCTRILGTQLPKLSCTSSMKSPGHGLRSGLHENANMWQQNWQLLQLQISGWPLFSINRVSAQSQTNSLSTQTNVDICWFFKIPSSACSYSLAISDDYPTTYIYMKHFLRTCKCELRVFYSSV